MKFLYNVGAIVSLLVIAAGLSLYWKIGLFHGDLGFCILALICGPSLSLMLNVLRLRDRIDALEKRQSQDK